MPSLHHIDPEEKAPSRLPIVLVLLVGASAVYWLHHVISPRTVVHSVLPNSVEIMVRQTFTWSGDLFDTKFLYRPRGGAWSERHYSYEDGYWAVETSNSIRRITALQS